MRHRAFALALTALAAVGAGLVASAPASAEATVTCTAPSGYTDWRIANVVRTVYRLPGGNTVTVTPATDPMTAGYAVERGTLTEVCMRLAPRRTGH